MRQEERKISLTRKKRKKTLQTSHIILHMQEKSEMTFKVLNGKKKVNLESATLQICSLDSWEGKKPFQTNKSWGHLLQLKQRNLEE